MVRRIVHWTFLSALTQLDCSGVTAVEPDPAQTMFSLASLVGQSVASARAFDARDALTCEGVRTECPLDPTVVERIEDTDDGVLLYVRPEAGNAPALQRRVRCYQAQAPLTGVDPERHDCALDVVNARVFVREERGKVVVDVTTREIDEVVGLRSDVRERLTHVAYFPAPRAQVASTRLRAR